MNSLSAHPPVAGHPLSLQQVTALCRALDAALAPGFGPLGLRTLVRTSVGEVLTTNMGLGVLEALAPSHPVARLLVDSVVRHRAWTGEGSKSFVALLAALLEGVGARLGPHSAPQHRASLARAFCRLRAELLPDFVCTLEQGGMRAGGGEAWRKGDEEVTEIRGGACVCVRGLLTALVQTSLAGKQSTVLCASLAQSLVHLLLPLPPCTPERENCASGLEGCEACGGSGEHPVPLGALRTMVEATIDAFPSLAVECPGANALPALRVVQAVVISRCFMHGLPTLNPLTPRSAPAPSHHLPAPSPPLSVPAPVPLRFVILPSPSEDDSENLGCAAAVYAARDWSATRRALSWRADEHRMLVAALRAQGVNLVLSGGRVPPGLAAALQQEGVAVVECVEGEELGRVGGVFGVEPAEEPSDLCGGWTGVVGEAGGWEEVSVGGGRGFILHPAPSGARSGGFSEWGTDEWTASERGVGKGGSGRPPLPPRQLLVLGPSPAVCRSLTHDLHDALKVIRMALSHPSACHPSTCAVDSPSSKLTCHPSTSTVDSSTIQTTCVPLSGGELDRSVVVEPGKAAFMGGRLLLGSMPGGGTFELSLHAWICVRLRKLPCTQHDRDLPFFTPSMPYTPSSPSTPFTPCMPSSQCEREACEILSEALLTVPARLLANSLQGGNKGVGGHKDVGGGEKAARRQLLVHMLGTWAETCSSQHAASCAAAADAYSLADPLPRLLGPHTRWWPPCGGLVLGVNGRTGGILSAQSRVVEPVAGRLALVSDCLQLLEQILRIDLILSARTNHRDSF